MIVNGNDEVIKDEGRIIIEEIEKIKVELDVARQNFDMATDSALIDCYIYEIFALNSKYQYFLKKAKNFGLIAEGFEDISVIA
ncbi:hypothetical protein SDC9_64730 [bioreactor metagenome]|uniref:DUF2508 domain-containing protein n=1 Tax=bioreactor metagenome TaxID=1076179 RepID=A0A644XQ38_9ZZZZ|nr:DUF2508 family protein [Candidatus Metalachnospira sp.]